MVSRDLIAMLHCPCCGAGLQPEHADDGTGGVHYGVLRCACYRYPVIEGIPVLRQDSGPADIHDEAVARIDAGDFAGAQRAVLARTAVARSAHWPERVARLLRRLPVTKQLLELQKPSSPTTGHGFREALARIKTPTYADYLYYRHANSSLLGAIPLIALLEVLSRATGRDATGPRTGTSPRVLDLACGVGHSTFVMSTLFPRYTVVAADHDLDNLLIAKRHMAPNAMYVCIDAELPLPFPDLWFDAVFCLDAFHYLRSKVALVQELNRVVVESGLWLFPHLHNAAGTNVSPGIPLSAEDYLRCFGVVAARLIPESVVLRDFIDSGGVDLRILAADAAAPHADVFSLVASRRNTVWQQHAQLDRLLLSRAGHFLAINPIYHAERRNGMLTLEIRWPNPHLEAECSAVETFLPRRCEVPESLLKFLRADDIPPEEVCDNLLDLIRKFVLVPLPEGYRQSISQ